MHANHEFAWSRDDRVLGRAASLRQAPEKEREKLALHVVTFKVVELSSLLPLGEKMSAALEWNAPSLAIINALKPLMDFLDTLGWIGHATHIVKLDAVDAALAPTAASLGMDLTMIKVNSDSHCGFIIQLILCNLFSVHCQLIRRLSIGCNHVCVAKQALEASHVFHCRICLGSVDFWS